MGLQLGDLPYTIRRTLMDGSAIPAHPLALDRNRDFDGKRQRALTRYYLDSGAGGLAVGVHTTQFEIREAGLYEAVLFNAAETATDWAGRPVVMIAGLAGKTAQAIGEAKVATGLGYHAGLLSLAAMKRAAPSEILEHCRRVALEIPLVGFYLQPAVGGIELGPEFWRDFCLLENVAAIKVAPFNRYRTLDVMRGLVEACAEDRIALYTGNDDHIVLDLALPFSVRRGEEEVTVRFRGGLLGHWSVWTKQAVEQFERIKSAVAADRVDAGLLSLDARVTDCNAAFFDVANNFKGCIAGCHEVLRRQGLLEGVWCLNPSETLSPGQMEAIDRVYKLHADLSDDEFVKANLHRWLA